MCIRNCWASMISRPSNLKVCAELLSLRCMWRKSWPPGLNRAPGRGVGSQFLRQQSGVVIRGCKKPLLQASLPGLRTGAMVVAVWIYDTRILRKTHVPVSDTISDTRTPRILPDMYPVIIGLFRYFQIIKINRILMGYLWISVRYLQTLTTPLNRFV